MGAIGTWGWACRWFFAWISGLNHQVLWEAKPCENKTIYWLLVHYTHEAWEVSTVSHEPDNMYILIYVYSYLNHVLYSRFSSEWASERGIWNKSFVLMLNGLCLPAIWRMCSRHQPPSPLAPKMSCTVLCSGKIIWRIGKNRQVGKEAGSYAQGSRTVWYDANRHVWRKGWL